MDYIPDVPLFTSAYHDGLATTMPLNIAAIIIIQGNFNVTSAKILQGRHVPLWDSEGRFGGAFTQSKGTLLLYLII